MDLSGRNFAALADDLDRAIDELLELFERAPSAWERGRPNKWTGGQHAEHVTKANELGTVLFEASRRALDASTLGPVPRRGPLQSLFFATVIHPGWIPRGASAIPPAHPGPSPRLDDVTRRLREAARRNRTVGTGLDAAGFDRLWIRNPFMTALRWHYMLPEWTRMQAVHIRHHAKQIAEIAGK